MDTRNELNQFEHTFEKNIDGVTAPSSEELKKTTDFFSETIPVDIDFSDEDTSTDNIFGDGFEDAEELFVTMGLQMEYTEQLAEQHRNHSIEAVQFIDVEDYKVREITQKLIEEYGEQSKQVQKWLEQLRKIDMYKKLQKSVIQKRRMQITIFGILIAFSIALIAGCIFMFFHSTNYYVNLGDYNRIYKKTMFGIPERVNEAPALTIQKQGSEIYYIDKNSEGLYKFNLKTKETKLITANETAYFVTTGKSIFYIDKSQGDKLFCISSEGGESRKILDNECSMLMLKGKKLTVKAPTGILYTVDVY